jgi:hypothetical protein
VGTGLAALVGVFAAGAGILHLLASRDHIEHPQVAAFFVVLALAQFAWGALVVWRRSPQILVAGAIGNLGVVAIWVLSRTTGIPIMDATAQVEPVGIADATATMFELIAAAGVGLLLALPAAALRIVLPQARAQRLIAGTASIALLLTVPAFVTEGHDHTHTHAEVDGLAIGHTHDGATLTSADGHTHDETSGLEASVGEVAHEHGVANEGASHVNAAESATGHTHVEAAHVEAAHADDAHHGHAASSGDEHDHSPPPSASRGEAPPAPKPRGQITSLLYGPFALPGTGAVADAVHREAVISNRILPAMTPPCVDCFVTSMTPDLVYADGTSANLDTGPMLHHTVIFDPTRDDPTCGRNTGAVGFIGNRIFASGNERTPMIMPEGYAIRVDRPWWAGIFEIMNDSPTPNLVFFKMTVTYLPASDTSVKPVTPVWLDVDNCGDSQFSVPKGESHSTWRWKSTVTGRVVGAGGHVHNGGISISLLNSSTNQRMCTSIAGYGTKPEYVGNIESMTACWHDRLGVVRKGEYLMLDAYYNSMTPQDNVMGIVMAFVYETNDLTGGSPPPQFYTAPPPNKAPPPNTGHHH